MLTSSPARVTRRRLLLGGRSRLAFGLAAWALGAALARGQTDPDLPSTNALKALSMEQLMDLEVTSVSKSPEKLAEAASAIQVITGDDIRLAGATNLPEALRLATNLEVAQIDARQWAISARGFNNVFADKMLVLIDGRTVYTPLYAGVYWDVQDTMLDDLDRIEVISGPGATQWGSNAVNGVINITSKSAKDTQGGLIFGQVGSRADDSGGVRYGAMLAPDTYFRVYAKYFSQGDSDPSAPREVPDAWRMAQTGFRVDRDAANGSVLTVQGDLYEGGQTQAGPADIHMSGGNLLGRWSRSLGENSEVKLQVYYDETYRDIPGSFTETLDTYDIDFQQRLPFGTLHDVVWGFGYRVQEDNIANTSALAFLPPRLALPLFNVFAEDKILLTPDLHLTVGTKLEHNIYTGFELEPSGRLAWTPDSRETVWSAISRAVRTPSRIDTDLYSPATPPYRIAGGPDVSSEKLIAYELGDRVQFGPQFAVSLAAYYNQYEDLRSLAPLDPPAAFPVQISSGLEGDSRGAELSADWAVTAEWRLRLGYTEMRVSSEPQVGSPDRSSNRSIATDPNHQAQVRSLLRLASRWDLDGALRYVGPIANQSVPGYTEMDLRLGWRPLRGWEISTVGQNLLHRHHAEFGAPNSRREIPRSVYEKVTWQF